MSDRYLKFVNTPVGKTTAQTLGLPQPLPLQRLKRSDQPFIEGDVLVGSVAGGKAISAIGSTLGASAATLWHAEGPANLKDSAKAGNKAQPLSVEGEIDKKFSALVLYATGLNDTTDLRAV